VNNANAPSRISCLGATGKIFLDQADQLGGGVRLRHDAMSIDAPTVDLVLDYKRSNEKNNYLLFSQPAFSRA
jgi:hypothetical protein